MMHIKYNLTLSSIHGIGIFAKENIPKDFCITEASPLLDINLTEKQFTSLSVSEQNEIKHHGHFDKILHKWHVDFDMTRFANHSEDPNLKQKYNKKGYYIITLKNIKDDEELTINYSDFENNSEYREFH